MFFLKHHQRQPRLNRGQEESNLTPKVIWARVPIQIDLRLRPGDPRNRSVYCLLRLPLTSLEIHAIKEQVLQEHISIEESFVAYLKKVIPRQETMRKIISRLHRNVTLDVELKGKIIWEVGEDQLFSGFS